MKPGVGVGIMIIKDNKILLGLRNPDKKKADSELKGEGTWTMPGGKVEFLEKLYDAAKRELKEETDLDAIEMELLSISDDITDDKHYVTVGFIASKYEGEVKTMEPETILQWKWFDLDKLPEKVYMPSMKCIECYKNKIIYNYNKGTK